MDARLDLKPRLGGDGDEGDVGWMRECGTARASFVVALLRDRYAGGESCRCEIERGVRSRARSVRSGRLLSTTFNRDASVHVSSELRRSTPLLLLAAGLCPVPGPTKLGIKADPPVLAFLRDPSIFRAETFLWLWSGQREALHRAELPPPNQNPKSRRTTVTQTLNHKTGTQLVIPQISL